MLLATELRRAMRRNSSSVVNRPEWPKHANLADRHSHSSGDLGWFWGYEEEGLCSNKAVAGGICFLLTPANGKPSHDTWIGPDVVLTLELKPGTLMVVSAGCVRATQRLDVLKQWRVGFLSQACPARLRRELWNVGVTSSPLKMHQTFSFPSDLQSLS